MSNPAYRRILFIDALRGFALFLMVLNHAAIYLLTQTLDPGRHYLVYLTISLSAPLFLFLVGFSLTLSFYRGRTAPLDTRPVHYWRYLKRGLGLLLAGYALNIVIAPHEPFYSGGILQTIGISIILLTPLLSKLQQRKFRDGVLIMAFLLYLLFVYAQPGIVAWSVRHPLMAHLFFEGYPPWPWISMVLIGLHSGYKWVEVENQANSVRRHLLQMQTLGIVCLTIYFSVNVLQGHMLNFNIYHDYIINGHWLPSSITVFWIIGMTLTGFTVMYRIFTNRYRYLRWLTVLGQSAFILYVVHLLVIVGMADRLFGLRIHQWWQFISFNLVLMVALVIFSGRLKLLIRQPEM